MSAKTGGELLRFGAAGIAGLLTDVAVLYLALAAGAGPFGARALSFIAAVFVTWQINRQYTFARATAAAAPAGGLWRQWWRYLGTMLFGGAVNLGLYTLILLLAAGPAMHPLLPMLAVACGALAGMAFNFIGAKLLVFHT